jgi:ATP-dependent Clp protease ATP-binding subunit ClpC
MSTLDHLQQRIADLVAGQTHARDAVVDLLRSAPFDTWLATSQHSEPVVRSAAMAASHQRTEPEAMARISELLADPAEPVRNSFIEALNSSAAWSVPGPVLATALEALARNEDGIATVISRSAGRPECLPILLRFMEANEYPTINPTAAAIRNFPATDVVLPIFEIATKLNHHDIDILGPLEHHLADPAAKALIELLDDEPLAKVASLITDQAERYPTLHSLLAARVADRIDLKELRAYGRVLTDDINSGALARGYLIDDSVSRVRSLVTRNPLEGPRAAMLIGAPGVGKSAIVNELAHALSSQPPLDDPTGSEAGSAVWTVIEMSPADFLVGTKWAGEFETRVKAVIDACSWPRRVILHMVNAEGLMSVGRTNSKDINATDILLPYLARGTIAMIAECSDSAYQSVLAGVPAFRRVFSQFDVVPSTAEETAELARRVADDAAVTVNDTTLAALLDLSDRFYGHIERPGRALTLLRQTIDTRADRKDGNTAASDQGSTVIDMRALLAVLNESTGVPVEFLDDQTALDIADVRRTLAFRVMGQPAAVEAALDTIVMCKAGLTDPNRPNGVLMFVGPTGVGKTELAKAMASVLFGDENRLVRFDMSEYASYDSYERLIGSPNRAGLLTEAIRAKPFSVILLDEIEKAHQNVFDLCLQMFDAGRLTDGRGTTVDLRSAIVILTSNVGSRIATAPSAGFVDARAMADEGTIRRELEHSFRPEFLNRLDRIVTFSPLDADTAVRIINREITVVVQRSGIVSRRITVDIDPAVISLLHREGYSPAFGARPLKRAIERRLLLPLGEAIAAGSIGRGALVRLRLDADSSRVIVERIRTRAVETDAVETDADVQPSSDQEAAAELSTVLDIFDSLTEPAAALAKRKSALLMEQTQPGFWDDTTIATAVLDEIQRIDRVGSDIGRLERDLERTRRNPDAARRAPYVAAHLREVTRLRDLYRSGDLRDAAVIIERVGGAGPGLRIVDQLAAMYEAMASREHLEVTVIDDVLADPTTGAVDRVTLLVSGPGAAVVFGPETGLHRFRDTSGAETITDLARVRVVSLDAVVPANLRTKMTLTKAAVKSVGRSPGKRTRVVAELKGGGSVELVSSASIEVSTEAAELMLCALSGATNEVPSDIIRRYDLSPSPLVRDARSGRSTGRLDRVLAGFLDLVR